MHIKDTIISYLYDKNYYIAVYEKNIYIFKYIELLKISSEEVIIKMDKFKINIKGSNLFIKKLLKEEILISGEVLNMEFSYE